MGYESEQQEMDRQKAEGRKMSDGEAPAAERAPTQGGEGGAKGKKPRPRKPKNKKRTQLGPKGYPAGLGGIERGKTKNPVVNMYSRIYMDEAVRTHEEAILPSYWRYREITAELAGAGRGPVIGLVNEILCDVVEEAKEYAEEQKDRMQRAMDRLADAMNGEVELGDLGEPHRVRIISGGEVTKKMKALLEEFDKAVTTGKYAYSMGAVPYQAHSTAVRDMIVKNRQILAVTKAISFVIKSKLPDSKIPLKEFRDQIFGVVTQRAEMAAAASEASGVEDDGALEEVVEVIEVMADDGPEGEASEKESQDTAGEGAQAPARGAALLKSLVNKK